MKLLLLQLSVSSNGQALIWQTVLPGAARITIYLYVSRPASSHGHRVEGNKCASPGFQWRRTGSPVQWFSIERTPFTCTFTLTLFTVVSSGRCVCGLAVHTLVTRVMTLTRGMGLLIPRSEEGVVLPPLWLPLPELKDDSRTTELSSTRLSSQSFQFSTSALFSLISPPRGTNNAIKRS